MTKKGVLVTDGSNALQCRRKGHKKFNWEIEIGCSNKLDNQGFIIDNAEIDKVVEVATRSTSCELLCREITAHLERRLKTHGCELKFIKIEIVPVMRNPKTRMELLTTY